MKISARNSFEGTITAIIKPDNVVVVTQSARRLQTFA